MTDRLYYADAGVLHFDATVTGVSADGRQLVLDRSAFYPTSGGQPHDTGVLAGVAVVDVTEADGVGDADGAVVHHLAAPYGGAVGDRVTGAVDGARRLDHQQQHSGQHLLSALAEDRFGWRTVGMHIGAAGCTVDLDTAGVGDEALAALEAQVNDAVAAARPVTVSFEAAATATGLRKPSARGGTLRIVTIAGVDRNACGGTHVAHSAQVGLVRLLRGEGIRGGTRVHFLCGTRALRQARQAHAWLHEAARTLSAGVEELPGVVARQADRLVAQERELTRLRETLGAHEARLLHATAAPDADGVRRLVFEVQGGVKAHEPLARAAAALPGCALLLLSHDTGGVLLAASADSGVDAGARLKGALAAHGGRGGGTPRLAQGALPAGAPLLPLLGALGFGGG